MDHADVVGAALVSIPDELSFEERWAEVCRRCDQLPVSYVRLYLYENLPKYDHSSPERFRKWWLGILMMGRYGDEGLKALLRYDPRITGYIDLDRCAMTFDEHLREHSETASA